ncbi:DUF4102 domain-containing protein [Methylocystis sp. H62]|uniref:Arm DNA-binding domain-containing protein n=1 Tax=Methylocystis sp. H62 TaxID=2785789 RepID=UPI0018C204EA|nr:Arm DNA-binding domain-containing protein [Methylocystis sp. H62]MBG0793058.1 DUF4102 domain-containing protein [Methylocystis sp. H62]
MRTKLRQSTIATLECPRERERVYFWDTKLGGFGVVVFLSGKKTYVAQYRDDGRSRRKTIGGAETVRFAEARAKAKALIDTANKKASRERAFKFKSTRLGNYVADHRAVVSLRLHRKLLAKIDKWAADHGHAAPGGLSRSAAIRMLLDHTLEMDGRYLPGGRRITLVIEYDDLERKISGSKAYGWPQRKAVTDKQAVARRADRYMSRDGVPKQR